MFLTQHKIGNRLHELSGYRYRDSQSISSFKSLEDTRKEINPSVPEVNANWNTFPVGGTWTGRDLYLWLSAVVEVPASWSGRRILGRFDFGETGGGNNSGFESLFYLHGKPYQGVDSNHMEVFFNEEMAGTCVELKFRLWSGLEGGGQPKNQTHGVKLAEICWLDEKVDDYYYTLLAVSETVKVLDENMAERAKLLKAADDSLLRIDWSEPGSEEFYASVYEACDFLSDAIDHMEKTSPVQITCIGHTHIDVAWLWRLKHTREKCARSFSTVMRLMEMYPEYVFLQTQPQLYEYVKEDYPELYEKIKERVAEGRWEAGGGMWLEADCNLTSGESLVRQLLVGTRFFKQEFDADCDYLWLPDVFGYSWSLPQILKKSGIHTFMTTKISWNQYNRMPHDTFKWRGIDGTEILTHFITTTEPWSQPGSWFYTYNGQIIPKTVKGSWDAYRDKEMNQELLLSYGYGDGGGGVNREMLEMRRRLDRMPGLPKLETGRADEYFRKLNKTVEDTTSYVHTWDGELYLEYHRGTYTSQAHNKRMNRKLELLYRQSEWLGVAHSVMKGDFGLYRGGELNEGWKIILRNQFHDIIPGSSIREVYEDSRIEYEEAERIGSEAWNQAEQALIHNSQPNVYTVWNSSPWAETQLVQIPIEGTSENRVWRDCDGRSLAAQVEDGHWMIEVRDVPAMGWTSIRLEEGEAAAAEAGSPFTIKPDGITTPYYELQWNEQGQLTRIYDIAEDREVLAAGAKGNVFQLFEDKPLAHEAWDIDIFYQQKSKELNGLVDSKVVETGPLRTVIRFEWKYSKSTLSQNMIVYANSRRIDFVTEADWHERQQLLKVAFPVNIRATEATYDIQYGNVKRPTHWNTSWDAARFETVGHQWADLSDKGYGVSLMNDCKYGYDIKNNVLRLSLIKCAIHPDTEADQGYHTFIYSLFPHTGDWLQGDTVRSAWALNNPLRVAEGVQTTPSLSMFRLSRSTAMISAVKKSEDRNRVIVRVHDFSGTRSSLTLESDLKIASWTECNLMEQPEGEVSTDPRITFVLEPYEIKTFEIDLKI
ncbi:alpha-mannosidase [Paenibacillus sp. J22TS3]|uniref:alpha-mannosidase n=1 Tax=Paenibacillus sp. J22TS3 TaxID=2807192 RepID=UPI001B0FCC68|nr:alpha-mannosidase [Paenibacillus sp. J22TS3]GIP24090.1 alpha-mannosidase [Paenibacillus sp. J22TS3]